MIGNVAADLGVRDDDDGISAPIDVDPTAEVETDVVAHLAIRQDGDTVVIDEDRPTGEIGVVVREGAFQEGGGRVVLGEDSATLCECVAIGESASDDLDGAAQNLNQPPIDGHAVLHVEIADDDLLLVGIVNSKDLRLGGPRTDQPSRELSIDSRPVK